MGTYGKIALLKPEWRDHRVCYQTTAQSSRYDYPYMKQPLQSNNDQEINLLPPILLSKNLVLFAQHPPELLIYTG